MSKKLQEAASIIIHARNTSQDEEQFLERIDETRMNLQREADILLGASFTGIGSVIGIAYATARRCKELEALKDMHTYWEMIGLGTLVVLTTTYLTYGFCQTYKHYKTIIEQAH